MDYNIAKLIVDHGEGDLELREEYSGRGMFGKETTGITSPNWDIFVKSCISATIEDPERMETLFDETISTAQMGLDMIIY